MKSFSDVSFVRDPPADRITLVSVGNTGAFVPDFVWQHPSLFHFRLVQQHQPPSEIQHAILLMVKLRMINR